MSLGKRIRALRKERKMTLVDLAGEQITKGMLSLIENDKSKPSMETFEYIARKLDVSIGYLTQEGDEAWTEWILDNADFNSTYTFPFEYIEEKVLPHLENISQNMKGMDLYSILRIYYRYKDEHEIADEYTEKINKFYKSMGMEHLAVRNILNDAISLMYSRDYETAYGRLVDSEEEILSFKEYDSRIELDYYYVKGIFSVSVDMEAFVDILNRTITLSHELENFKYYFSENIVLGYYYGLAGDMENYERCRDNIRKYMDFNRQDKYEVEVIDLGNPIPLNYLLVEDPARQAGLYETYIEKIDRVYEKDREKFTGIHFYRPILKLEQAYFEADYHRVIENYHDGMYIRTTAQYPVDRILMAIRSCVHPLSLYHLGRVEEAKEAFLKIESTIDDIRDSIFTKELYMIRDMILGEPE